MNVERLSVPEWNQALPDSGFSVFHTTDALGVIDAYTAGELSLFAATKGTQVVGLLPVFLRDTVIGKAAFSPPPGMGIPQLGPLLMPNSPKRRKQESVNKRFIRGVLDELELPAGRSLLRLICPPDYSDPRPFLWNEYDLETSFTYVVDVASHTEDSLLSSFSRDLRKDVRDGSEKEITLTVEGGAAARRVYRDVAERYTEQGEQPPLTGGADYVADLVESLGERARVYVARDGAGTYLSGIVVLYSNDVAMFWQGGVRTPDVNGSTNGLIHWNILTDLLDDDPIESVTGYDLVGANTERLCGYKAKFGGDLVPYYTIESAGAGMTVAKRAYQLVN